MKLLGNLYKDFTSFYGLKQQINNKPEMIEHLMVVIKMGLICC